MGPEIVGIDEILAMARGISRSGTFGNIHIYPEAVDVVHENRVPVNAPVFVAEVEHRTGVGVPPASGCRPEITRMRALVAQPMHVVCNRFDVGV